MFIKLYKIFFIQIVNDHEQCNESSNNKTVNKRHAYSKRKSRNKQGLSISRTKL